MIKYLFYKKKYLFITTIFIIIRTILTVILAFLLKYIIDIASSGNFEQMKTILLLIIVFSILEPISCFGKDFFKIKYLKSTMIILKKDIFDSIFKKNISMFSEKNTGTYISVLTNDTNILEQDYFDNAINIIDGIVNFTLGIIALINISIVITFSVVILSIIIFLVPLFWGGILNKYKKIYSDNSSSFMSKTKDMLLGFEIIKSFNIQNQTKEEFEKINCKVENSKAKYLKLNYLADNVAGIAGNLVFFSAIVIGSYLALNGKITIGTALASMQLVNNVSSPIQSISVYMNKLKSTKSIRKKVTDILVEDVYQVGKESKNSFDRTIIFDNVKFSYEECKNILNGVSLEINKGCKYAIVGQSGCGKSTLIKLLSGYFTDFEGDILIDDSNIKNLGSDSIANLISMIHQNVFIFDDDIKNNISLFNNYNTTSINEIIDFVNLNYLIDNDKKHLGENGSYLSGGEKQRIAIARALIKDTPIIILDEATSSLDNKNSYELENSLLSLNNLTCIVVTHKLNANILRKYDKIFVLNNGIVKESGTFDELISRKEFFYNLFNVNNS